jgi:2-aminoadipate transaminase
VLASSAPVLRAHYRRKKETMEAAMTAELGGLVTWQAPRGGFFIWLALPAHLSGDQLLPAAMEERIVYVAGAAFFVDGSGQSYIRLSFSAPTHERIVEGVGRLARVVRKAAER